MKESTQVKRAKSTKYRKIHQFIIHQLFGVKNFEAAVWNFYGPMRSSQI